MTHPMTNPEGDWPEDFADENGNYYCTCVWCAKVFSGYKRRIVCKACHTKNEDAKDAALGRYVRRKFKSGNGIRMERIFLTANEVDVAMEQKP